MTAAVGMAALVILFPVIVRIVQRIGLPWIESAGRYAELWRREFERWLDEQYKQRGFDPDAAKAAGDALLDELIATTDSALRRAWERLVALLCGKKP